MKYWIIVCVDDFGYEAALPEGFDTYYLSREAGEEALLLCGEKRTGERLFLAETVATVTYRDMGDKEVALVEDIVTE